MATTSSDFPSRLKAIRSTGGFSEGLAEAVAGRKRVRLRDRPLLGAGARSGSIATENNEESSCHGGSILMV